MIKQKFPHPKRALGFVGGDLNFGDDEEEEIFKKENGKLSPGSTRHRRAWQAHLGHLIEFFQPVHTPY